MTIERIMRGVSIVLGGAVRELRTAEQEEEEMNESHHKKLVREGNYVAEVEVELIATDEGWSPYLSLEDAYKLDEVCQALRGGDLKSASRLARVYTLTPVAV